MKRITIILDIVKATIAGKAQQMIRNTTSELLIVFSCQVPNLYASSVGRSVHRSVLLASKTRRNPFPVYINRYSFVITKRRNHCAG